MNEADERRYEYEAQQRAPKPELVYEYRVVCANGAVWGFRDYDQAVRASRAFSSDHPRHEHTVERRAVGRWEAT